MLEHFKRDWHWLIFFRPDYDRYSVLTLLKGCNVKIIQQNGLLAGFIAYFMQYKHAGLILFLDVAPDFRNRGFGKVLLNYALQDLKNSGANHTKIVARLSNEPALHLYTKIGFEEYNRNEWFSYLAYKY